MTKPIVSDQFDYLFKLVVVGGTNINIEIRGWEKPTCSLDLPPTNSPINRNQPLVYSLPPRVSTFKIIKLKHKFGTLLDNKDLEPLHRPTIRELLEH